HIVRERAVSESLVQMPPTLDVYLQTETHLKAAQRFIPKANFHERFNNIRWDKLSNGSPDVEAIHHRFTDYIDRSLQFIAEEKEMAPVDFIVSDFVYEAFEVGRAMNTPAFGVAHFTWDWFFSKLYPPPIHTDVMRHFLQMASQATRLYFPPFTPEEIVRYHRGKAMQVPLILHQQIEHKVSESHQRFKVLIMDSGAGVLADSIREALKSLADLDDFLFFVSDRYALEQENIRTIPSDDLMVDYVADMDLVIGRAGFNTISECVGLRTPMLLIGEAMNPEMNENILMLKKEHLGSFISLETFEKGLSKFLPSFVQHEYPLIQSSMRNHSIATNGADIIAQDILNHL
ncbi:MAG: glycosyltransferase, partial [Flavobacteriales bacterium]